MHLHPQIQIPNAFPGLLCAPSDLQTFLRPCSLCSVSASPSRRNDDDLNNAHISAQCSGVNISYLSQKFKVSILKSSWNKKDLNDVTAAPFSVSFSQLPAAKKSTKKGPAVTSLSSFLFCDDFSSWILWAVLEDWSQFLDLVSLRLRSKTMYIKVECWFCVVLRYWKNFSSTFTKIYDCACLICSMKLNRI